MTAPLPPFESRRVARPLTRLPKRANGAKLLRRSSEIRGMSDDEAGNMENGGSEGREQAAGGALKKPERTLALFQRAPEGALLRSSSLTVVSFLIHILFLLFVDPSNYPYISKETIFIISAIPLCLAVVFLILAVYFFIKIENRSILHISFLLVAFSFGSMSLQGLLGLGLHYVKLELQNL